MSTAGNFTSIPAIRSLEDCRRAIENIRNWLAANPPANQLNGVNGLVFMDQGRVSGKVLHYEVQAIGKLITGVSGQTVDPTKYYQIQVGGTTIKLAVLT